MNISFFSLHTTLILILSLLNISNLFSQTDTIKNYFNDGKIESIIPMYNGVRDGNAKFYNGNGKLKAEISYTNGRVDGLVKFYNESGILTELFTIENGKREGPTSYFDSTGKFIEDKIFVEGKLTRPEKLKAPIIEEPKNEIVELNKNNLPNQPNNKINSNDKSEKQKENESSKISETIVPPINLNDENIEEDPAFFNSVEVMPEPVGGMESIYKRLVYPELAKKKKIQGTVEVIAYIERNGDVVKTEIKKGLGYGCDDAAAIVVYYTKFKPGLIRGKKVKVQMVIPIEFKLQ